jgi:transposase
VAVARSLIELVWHLLTTGEVFEDLGDDYFQRRREPDRQARRLVAQLDDLRFTVTIAAA